MELWSDVCEGQRARMEARTVVCDGQRARMEAPNRSGRRGAFHAPWTSRGRLARRRAHPVGTRRASLHIHVLGHNFLLWMKYTMHAMCSHESRPPCAVFPPALPKFSEAAQYTGHHRVPGGEASRCR